MWNLWIPLHHLQYLTTQNRFNSTPEDFTSNCQGSDFYLQHFMKCQHHFIEHVMKKKIWQQIGTLYKQDAFWNFARLYVVRCRISFLLEYRMSLKLTLKCTICLKGHFYICFNLIKCFNWNIQQTESQNEQSLGQVQKNLVYKNIHLWNKQTCTT